MLIISPYDTTYGKKINISSVNKELVKYITSTNNKNLNYEYVVNDSVGFVIITGCDNDEKSLPIMEHPVIIKDVRNKEIVVVDIRKYVKPIVEQPLYIKDIIKDQASVMFIINRGITTIDFIANDFGNYRNMFKHIITGYAMVISNTINSMVALTPTEKIDVELTAALFANMLLTTDDNIEDTLDATEARLGTCKLSLPISRKYINSKIIILDTKDKTIDGLVNNIKLILGNSKSDIITTNVLVNMLLIFGTDQVIQKPLLCH